MAIPTPEPGLIISYAYVWDHEARSGQEEGRKDRPCVITLAVERQQDGETLVTVLPVTHRPPKDAAAAEPKRTARRDAPRPRRSTAALLAHGRWSGRRKPGRRPTRPSRDWFDAWGILR